MWVTYGNTMLSEISQTGNVTYCVIPLIRAKSLETVSGERSPGAGVKGTWGVIV